jgi:Domain of Unknown Function (DUF1080)
MSSSYPPFGSGSAPSCRHCGQPLSPNEAQCSNCGYYNANGLRQSPSDPSWRNSSPQASFGATPMGGTPWAQVTAQPARNSPFASPFYSQPSSQTAMSNGYPSNSFAQTPPAPSPHPMGGLQPGGPNGYRPETFTQPPKKKGRLKIGLIIAIVALLIVVVGGGLFAYFSLRDASNSTSQTTPHATSTPTPIGHPLFTDSFIDNKNGWDTSSKNGQFSVKIGGGSLAVEDDNHRLLWELVPSTQHFSDFYITVDANLSKGSQSNGYGIYIRGSLNQNNELATYYRFELYVDGSFAVFKGVVDASGAIKNDTLFDYTLNSAILKQGQTNHVAINAKGSTMTFTVNGQVLATVTDSTYPSGSIALFVSNFPTTPAGAQATFSNLAIYPAQP